ncbi:MAG: TonB-dependent receptor, partial [Acidobacteriota bacterium]|nr:TonB-dependent receptor [Acidobacteriota bacterium]
MNHRIPLPQAGSSVYRIKRLLASFSIVLFTSFMAVSQNGDGQILSGTVVDGNGSAVSGAEIQLIGPGFRSACNTDRRGVFICKVGMVGKLEITIRAEGFSILRQTIANIQEHKGLKPFQLDPPAVREEVVVSVVRAKTSIDETPASISTLGRNEITSSAADAVDGILRQSVGFTVFRRSGSRHSNPTTQGASLRGVNSSGASRAGVFLESVPLNDPFGGWVLWSRVPRISLERIDVLRGGSSPIYGSGSIGGTVLLMPRRAERSLDISAEFSAATAETFEGSVFAGLKASEWSSELVVNSFQTKGYRIVSNADRGLVDDFANSRNNTATLRIARSAGALSEVFAKASLFGEVRNNGTPVQSNRTHLRDFAVGSEMGLGEINENWKNHRLKAEVYGGTQVFDQTFSAVADDRNSESLVRLQRVPAQRLGFTMQVVSLYRGNSIAFGVEGLEVRGSSNETGFFGGTVSTLGGAGGRERRFSVHLQDFFRLNEHVNLSGSVRYDQWRNFRGLSSTTRVATGINLTETFEDRFADAVSPHGAVLVRINPDYSIYASAGRSFRAPTLNELYRGFRVGNVITGPNALLLAEKAMCIEGGVRYSKGPFNFHASAFRTTISEAISNVTIDPGPGLIIRQRRNASETRSQGFEIEGGFQKDTVSLTAGYLYLDARVARFESDPQLVGLRIPQVPAHQFTVQSEFRLNGKWTVSVQGRGGSAQFDDDLNRFRLEHYAQVDLYASRRFAKKTRVFAAIENMFNSRHSVRLTPVRTVSPPF